MSAFKKIEWLERVVLGRANSSHLDEEWPIGARDKVAGRRSMVGSRRPI
jgi:hypothetical protein